MNERTCTTENCERQITARGLCGPHYNQLRRTGELVKLPPNPTAHRLTEVDASTATATCSLCGPTRIRIRRGNRGHQCITLRLLERARSSHSGRSPESRRAYNLRMKYGISVDEYERMLAEQIGRCAICGKQPDSRRRLAVDHDHLTGALRGLLCTSCNTGIGHLRDDAERLRLAHDYLITPREVLGHAV